MSFDCSICYPLLCSCWNAKFDPDLSQVGAWSPPMDSIPQISPDTTLLFHALSEAPPDSGVMDLNLRHNPPSSLQRGVVEEHFVGPPNSSVVPRQPARSMEQQEAFLPSSSHQHGPAIPAPHASRARGSLPQKREKKEFVTKLRELSLDGTIQMKEGGGFTADLNQLLQRLKRDGWSGNRGSFNRNMNGHGFRYRIENDRITAEHTDFTPQRWDTIRRRHANPSSSSAGVSTHHSSNVSSDPHLLQVPGPSNVLAVNGLSTEFSDNSSTHMSSLTLDQTHGTPASQETPYPLGTGSSARGTSGTTSTSEPQEPQPRRREATRMDRTSRLILARLTRLERLVSALFKPKRRFRRRRKD